jgi:hypothetical protein
MLCIKIGYAEEKNCLAISCKDAEENLFPPVFLDASKILQAKGSEFEALIEESYRNLSHPQFLPYLTLEQ